MARPKVSKKLIIIPIIVVVCLIVLDVLLSGINIVPFKYRNKPVSFITPSLTWDSKPSDLILKYGFPTEIGEVNDITGERDFDFNFDYDDKDVYLSVDNAAIFLNSEIHRYYYEIECNTPEEAIAYFDECHKKLMDLYKDEPDFKFTGTNTTTDYQYSDGTSCGYVSSHENGAEEVFIIDDDFNEIPLEDAQNVAEIKTKENSYDMCNTTGTSYSLCYRDGESCVTLRADILY